MTATDTELEQIGDLDQVPVCEDLDGCDQEATWRGRNVCGCHFLICTHHAGEELAENTCWSSWICNHCQVPLGTGYGRQFTQVMPL